MIECLLLVFPRVLCCRMPAVRICTFCEKAIPGPEATCALHVTIHNDQCQWWYFSSDPAARRESSLAAALCRDTSTCTSAGIATLQGI